MASSRVAHRQSSSVLSLIVDAAQVDQAEIWDMIVVGGGPAGLGAALIGAQSKLKVLLIDKEKI